MSETITKKVATKKFWDMNPMDMYNTLDKNWSNCYRALYKENPQASYYSIGKKMNKRPQAVQQTITALLNSQKK